MKLTLQCGKRINPTIKNANWNIKIKMSQITTKKHLKTYKKYANINNVPIK